MLLWHPPHLEGSVRHSLAVAALVNLWALVHSLLAARTLRSDLERVA